jgi:serine/threonine protein kinase
MPDQLDIVQLLPGDKIGEWTIENKLGQGSFGAVYLVKNKKNEQYALKVESASEVVKVLKMEVFVMNELKRIHGRHFCDLLDTGRIGNFKYIVMTLLGPSLHVSFFDTKLIDFSGLTRNLLQLDKKVFQSGLLSFFGHAMC